MSAALLLLGGADGDELIDLTGIAATGYHGVYEFERREGQTFVVDCALALARPSRDDDVETTVHYGELAEQIVGLVTGAPVDLIETLAHRIADAVLTHPRVRRCAVTVHKPQAPIEVSVADASVSVIRGR